MSAEETLAAWRAACGGSAGGENIFRHAGELYVVEIFAPERLANGAIRGRIHRFGPKGLVDAGGYKIAANGSVVAWPEALRGALPGTGGSPASAGSARGPRSNGTQAPGNDEEPEEK